MEAVINVKMHEKYVTVIWFGYSYKWDKYFLQNVLGLKVCFKVFWLLIETKNISQIIGYLSKGTQISFNFYQNTWLWFILIGHVLNETR